MDLHVIKLSQRFPVTPFPEYSFSWRRQEFTTTHSLRNTLTGCKEPACQTLQIKCFGVKIDAGFKQVNERFGEKFARVDDGLRSLLDGLTRPDRYILLLLGGVS